MKLFSKNTLSPFDYFLIIGVIVTSVIYSVFTGEFDVLGFVASFTGLVCVVLSAKGSILNYVFGLVNVTLYAYIAYKSKLYGDAALNALFYIPMQFVGWFSWQKKKQSQDESKVKARRMSTKQLILLIAVCAVAVAGCGYILDKVGDPQPYKDSATNVLSIIAMFLMVRAFTEQWYLWIVTNVISVIMWIILTVRGEAHAETMIIMWVFYLANSINGLIQWLKLSQSSTVPTEVV
ncbi:MAG: nicotinamide riboside transporter PnuC [Bacteroidales bacterium]|nr:nicotinamide riboside transporter PnuC [Bacteroidales bacterium]